MTTYLQGPPRYSNIPDKALPVMNPYSVPNAFYTQINDTLGPAGKVVDWILVEIWGNIEPTAYSYAYDLVEARPLLLKPDGTVVDTNGNKPVFKPYSTDSVRIVVKHRNHLAVISSALFPFNSDIIYNFSTSSSQAFKFSWTENQELVYKNGLWCMWAGDIWYGNTLDLTWHYLNATDASFYYNALNSYILGNYMSEDVNMDGQIDDGDGSVILRNSRLELESPILFFIKKN